MNYVTNKNPDTGVRSIVDRNGVEFFAKWGADWREIDAPDADLVGWDLRGIVFCNVHMVGWDLRKANLSFSNFLYAWIVNTNLSDSIIKQSTLEGCDFLECHLFGATVRDCRGVGVKFTRCKFGQMDIRDLLSLDSFEIANNETQKSRRNYGRS